MFWQRQILIKYLAIFANENELLKNICQLKNKIHRQSSCNFKPECRSTFTIYEIDPVVPVFFEGHYFKYKTH